MKLKLYSLLLVLGILFSGCSKDEEFITISPSKINFVKEDGSLLTVDDCINPVNRYGVLIETEAEGNGSFKPTKVSYTVNGVAYNMTFMRSGTQINFVSLVDGLNVAQIAESGYVATINYVLQDEFELVE